MSEVAQVALITGMITGVVGIAGLAFNFWNSSRERQLRLTERREDNREWYKRTLFEKRLQAIQEGYEWLTKLNRYVNLADLNDRTAEANQELAKTCLEARDWYDNNTIFLYASIPSSSDFLGAVNSAASCSMGNGSHHGFFKQHDDASKEIRRELARLLNGRDVG